MRPEGVAARNVRAREVDLDCEWAENAARPNLCFFSAVWAVDDHASLTTPFSDLFAVPPVLIGVQAQWLGEVRAEDPPHRVQLFFIRH